MSPPPPGTPPPGTTPGSSPPEPPTAGSRPDPPEPETAAWRTRQAWRRTVLATTVVALLAGRLAVQLEPTWPTGAGLAAAGLGWFTVVATGYRRGRALQVRRPGPDGRPLRLACAVTIGYAVVGIVLTILASG